MFYFIVAQIFGALALTILIISLQKNNKTKLLLYQSISSLLYALQYLFLNAYTGCLMNLICMIRNMIFNRYPKKRPPVYWLIITIVLMIFFSSLSYTGVISFLPMIAVILYSIALWHGNLTVIRTTEIISCSLYILYNIKVLAITGLIATIIELVGAILAVYKFDIKKKKENR